MNFGYLIHMTNYWKLPNILKDEEIIGNPFSSFSYGIPTKLCNGNVAIIFNREKIENKGNNFIEIQYTDDFFNEYPEIEKYVVNWCSIEDAIKERVDGLEFELDGLRHSSNKVHIEEKISIIKKINELKNIKNHKYNTRVSAIGFEYENEIILKHSLKFNIDDVIGIILFSRTINAFFPIPYIYKPKIEYAEDYSDLNIDTTSEIYEKIITFNNFKDMKIGGKHTLPSFYYVASMVLLNPEIKCDIIHSVRDVVSLSKKEIFILHNLQYASDNLRVALENVLMFKSILCSTKEDAGYENFLYNKLIDELKNIDV